MAYYYPGSNSLSIQLEGVNDFRLCLISVSVGSTLSPHILYNSVGLVRLSSFQNLPFLSFCICGTSWFSPVLWMVLSLFLNLLILHISFEYYSSGHLIVCAILGQPHPLHVFNSIQILMKAKSSSSVQKVIKFHTESLDLEV